MLVVPTEELKRRLVVIYLCQYEYCESELSIQANQEIA